MRSKAKIIREGLTATVKGVTLPDSQNQLHLLQTEVLLDIRDYLTYILTALTPGTMDEDEGE